MVLAWKLSLLTRTHANHPATAWNGRRRPNHPHPTPFAFPRRSTVRAQKQVLSNQSLDSIAEPGTFAFGPCYPPPSNASESFNLLSLVYVPWWRPSLPRTGVLHLGILRSGEALYDTLHNTRTAPKTTLCNPNSGPARRTPPPTQTSKLHRLGRKMPLLATSAFSLGPVPNDRFL